MHSFKKAIIKSSIFILVFAILYSPFAAIYYIFGSDNNNWIPEYKNEKGKIDVVFCGASQSVWGFIPEIMDTEYGCNSFNASSGLLSMEGRYSILKDILNENPVKVLVMDLSFGNLTRSSESDTVEGKLLLMEHFQGKKRFLYGLKHIKIDEYFPASYYVLRTGVSDFKNLVFAQSNDDTPYRGKGYWGNHEALYQKGNVYWEKGKYPKKTEYIVTEENLEYLDKIMSVCNEKNIEVVFVTTPYPTPVISWSDRDAMLEIHKSLADKYSCKLYDINLLIEKSALYNDDTCYYDVEHTSTEGAVITTRLLADLLKNSDSGTGKSNLFYRTYRELIDAYFT